MKRASMSVFGRNKVREKRIVTNEEDYAYCTGRFRSLENTLLSRNIVNRLFDADDPGEIFRILTENGFPPSGNVEKSVRNDLIENYELALKLIPNKEYIKALMCFNDFHNLKVILKSFVPGNTYLSGGKDKTDQDSEDIVLSTVDFVKSVGAGISDEEVFLNFLYPGNYDPGVMFDIIRNTGTFKDNENLNTALVKALKAYTRTSDPGDIDTTIDIHYYRQLVVYDDLLRNRFFHEYIAYMADSTNLGILLRLRAMKADPSRIRYVCVEGGDVSLSDIYGLYSESNDRIKEAFRKPCGDLVNFTDKYGTGNTALEFGKAVDDHIISMVEKTRYILFGPEIIIAFLLRKEMQAKNINIALTCVRNKVPMTLAADMMRNTL